MTHLTKLAGTLLALLFVLAISACDNNSDPVGPTWEVAGTYDLVEVNGLAIPANHERFPVSGTLTLSTNGAYLRRVFYRGPTPGTLSESVGEAFWRVRGLDFQLATDDPDLPGPPEWYVMTQLTEVGEITIMVPGADDFDMWETYHHR